MAFIQSKRAQTALSKKHVYKSISKFFSGVNDKVYRDIVRVLNEITLEWGNC
jgi:hypothetical protein